MRYVTEAEVRELLPMHEAIGLMREAFLRLRGGAAQNQPRRRLFLPTRSVLHYMAASDGKYFGAKIYATHPEHGAHFRFLLYRAEDAAPLAVLEANYLGQIRTGAVTGLATDLMAARDASVLGLIGAGFQARTQLEAVLAVRPIQLARVWSRSREKRDRFAKECSRAFPVDVRAAESAEEAVREARIVVTATSAREPVLSSHWIAPGTHINAVGSNHPQRRELPADLVERADMIVVDSLEQARTESGDLLLTSCDWERKTIELKDALARPDAGRKGAVSIFKSNGLALEDVIAAGFVYERLTEV
ncbi:MAG: ornithine cyclodeaminase family protein [Bryobacteraceae bacterium]